MPSAITDAVRDRARAPGQVPGELVAAAFAVFDPAVVVPAVTHAWTR